jgi:hypothetical protein
VAAEVSRADGVREVPQPRRAVWEALAALEPYCPVCDVSYVVTGTGAGTTFVCVPGPFDGRDPGPGATRGEIVLWEPRRVVGTRLDLPAETWTTRIELADVEGGGTRVAMTLECRTTGGNRLVRGLQARTRQRLVQRTLDAELEKLPAHIAQAGRPV